MAADPLENTRGLREGGKGEADGQEEGKEDKEEEEGQVEPHEKGGHRVHRQQRQHLPANGTKNKKSQSQYSIKNAA